MRFRDRREAGALLAKQLASLSGQKDLVVLGIPRGGVVVADEIADAILDRANAIETSYTLRQALRILLAADGGKLSGAATTTITIRNAVDTKDRIVATVDADGNRSAVTLDTT